MNIESQSCDAARIARFLRHELSEADENALIQHLDGCPTCSARLESETAERNWWQAAGEFLADGPFELEPLSDQSAPSDTPSQGLMVQQVLDHLAPTDDPEMMGRIGSYEVVGVVGSGGMGVVLKAFDKALDRYVAIKTLSPTLATSGSARKRFSREARAAAAVVHDNVSEIYGVAEANGLPYLVMPYVRGTSLQRRVDDSGPLTPAEVLRIGMQTAAGLAAAHAQGLVHRDIKPANILLSEGVERVQITDFGLARAADDASLTRTGVIAGTPQYMSPEQARGEAVDHRSDLFSLGSVTYAMCTGRPPFRAETSYGILRRITDSEPRPIREINPEIPTWLCAVIQKLHAKSPDERYQSAGEVAELLGQCLAHVQQPDTQPLPATIATLARRASEGRRWRAGGFPRLRFGLVSLCRKLTFQARPGRLWKAILQHPRASVAALVVVAIVAFVAITRVPWRDAGRPAVQRRAGSGDPRTAVKDPPTSPTGNATTADDPDPATDWNAADDEVRQLTQQGDELTSRINRLWDDMPATAQGETQLNSSDANSSLAEESDP